MTNTVGGIDTNFVLQEVHTNVGFSAMIVRNNVVCKKKTPECTKEVVGSMKCQQVKDNLLSL